LPFVVYFLAVIGFIVGPLVTVPALAVPLVLALGPFVRLLLNEDSPASLNEGRNKQGVLVETIGALELVKASGAARMMRRRWRQSVVQHSQVSTQSRLVSQLAVNGTMLAQQAANVGIVVYGAVLASRGEVSMGAIIAFVMLSGRTLAPLAQIGGVMPWIPQAIMSFQALGAD